MLAFAVPYKVVILSLTAYLVNLRCCWDSACDLRKTSDETHGQVLPSYDGISL